MLSLCFNFMMKTAGYSLAHAMLQALYFTPVVSKKAMKIESQQRVREGDKISTFH